jgi:hypothetical protein
LIRRFTIDMMIAPFLLSASSLPVSAASGSKALADRVPPLVCGAEVSPMRHPGAVVCPSSLGRLNSSFGNAPLQIAQQRMAY